MEMLQFCDIILIYMQYHVGVKMLCNILMQQ